jgi:ferrous-iron efflux pump FieF
MTIQTRSHAGAFVPHYPGSSVQTAAWAAVAVAGLLIVMKAVAYVITGSIAMMASLADSGLDLFGSTINLLAIYQALAPADSEHRFGHGKAEPLAGLAQGAFIAGSATFLVIESASRLIAPHPITHGVAGVVVMVISIIAVLFLVVFQRLAVRRTGSLAIGADLLHYLGDLLTNIGVIAGIVLSTRFGLLIADPIVGLVVAVILSAGAWHVFRQSYDQLMDHELPENDRARIKEIVMSHRGVRSLHDLRTRAAGISTFIQLHIELDPAISLISAHELSDLVEADIRTAFPNSEIIIHQDPAGVESPPALSRS